MKVPAGIVYTEISEEHPGMNPAFLEYTDGYLREEEIEDEKGNILVVRRFTVRERRDIRIFPCISGGFLWITI